jgi:hypothetical protein
MRPIYTFEIEIELNDNIVHVYKLEQKNYTDQNIDIRILTKNFLRELYVNFYISFFIKKIKIKLD